MTACTDGRKARPAKAGQMTNEEGMNREEASRSSRGWPLSLWPQGCWRRDGRSFWCARTDLGTGRRGDVIGSRCSLVLLRLCFVGRCRFYRRPGGCCRRRRSRIAERDPDVGIVLRLAHDEAVTGFRPPQNVFDLVVEDE